MTINTLKFRRCKLYNYISTSFFHSSPISNSSQIYKVLVVGGGSAGCSTASKLCSTLKKDSVGIIEPSEDHYYQPMFTLVGGGMKNINASRRSAKSVLPRNAKWIKDKIVSFDPDKNKVQTASGLDISYEFLILATGVQLQIDRIKGLSEALENPNSGVSTNYSPKYAEKTFKNLKKFKGGTLLCTFPNTAIKCGGAPIKAVLISDEYLKKNRKSYKANVIYCTAHPAIFPSPFYAGKIHEVLKNRGIDVRMKKNLVEIDESNEEAVFQSKVDETIHEERIPYTMAHVVPPMGPIPELQNSSLTDQMGYVTVEKQTLQHTKYKNVFALGDCANLPTSKTAAAVAAQSKVVFENLTSCIQGKPISTMYNGYTSCPLVTGYSKCIMAEFDYTLEPLETFPIDQSKERNSMFFMKKEVMPFLYWNLMLNGYWNGPGLFREWFHLGGLLKQQNRT